MPDPSKYKPSEKSDWMEDCLHQTLHKEKKEKEHGLAQCLNMWRQRHKKTKVADYIRIFAKYIREKGDQPGVITLKYQSPFTGKKLHVSP